MSNHHHCHGDHHHHHDSCCSEDIEDECCHTNHHECCGHHHHEHHHNFAHELLELADEAWMELLKEKIKASIQKKSGAHLDELAKLVSDANEKRWSNKLGGHSVNEAYEEKVSTFFHPKQK